MKNPAILWSIWLVVFGAFALQLCATVAALPLSIKPNGVAIFSGLAILAASLGLVVRNNGRKELAVTGK
jgi:hypothetical protein